MKPCNQCGKCCIKYGNGGLGSASRREINHWEIEAPEVLEYVDDFLGDLWLDPETGEEMDYCPWLDKEQDRFICTIYKVRPEVCHEYPVDIEQMKSDACEMLEPSDFSRSDDELIKELTKLTSS